MGNGASYDASVSVCCMSPEDDCFASDENTIVCVDTEKDTRKITTQGPLLVYDKRNFSFSSLVADSSKGSAQSGDVERPRCKEGEERVSILQVEMRNDAEYCPTMSDELRAIGSSYDETTSEALSAYYSRNYATYGGQVKQGRFRSDMTREARE